MSELDARDARGQDTRRMFGGGTITSAGSVPGAWDVEPDLERILGEALFGTIWHRDALSPVQREMITLSTLIVLAREPQLRRHLGNALHIGFAQFIRICRWLKLLYKEQFAPLENAPFSCNGLENDAE